MTAPSTNHGSRAAQYLSGVILVSATRFGLAGCGTFSGMTEEERDQANKDLAKESKILAGV
jgi:hypothetical protein